MKYYVMDEQGNVRTERDFVKWGKWYENADNRRIAKDQIGDVTVSTVFLSIDHAYDAGPPVLFETMIFGPSEHNEAQERYHTRDEALAGHARWVELVRKEANGA